MNTVIQTAGFTLERPTTRINKCSGGSYSDVKEEKKKDDEEKEDNDNDEIALVNF